MGNQEAKQKKAAAASGNGSYASLDEGWREGGGEVTKKGGKKVHSKHGGKGTSSNGGGGGHGTGPGKKKHKSESKSSVFSIRKRKSNLKGKADVCSSVSGSKEDVLASRHDELDGTKTPDVSADELGHSDTEAVPPESRKKVELEPRDGAGGGGEKQEASPTEEGGQKGGSSGSDTDIYSFHSAAEHEDLLADIQLAIRLQQQGGGNSIMEARGEGDLSWGGGATRKQSNGGVKVPPPEVLDLTPELELGSDALSFLCGSAQDPDEPPPLPSLAEEEEGRRGREASLCAETSTKDQHAWLQRPPHPAVTMDTEGGAAVSPVTMTTSGNSFPDGSFDRAGEPPGGQEEAGGEVPQQVGGQRGVDPAPADTEGRSSGTAFDEGEGQLGSGTSTESLEDCRSAAGSAQQSRAESAGLSSPPPQDSPTLAKRLLRSSHCSSCPVVKPYPPIFPSYIKTTTRQLSSPGHSPALSPSHSPLSPRRAPHQLHRYLWRHFTFTVSDQGLSAEPGSGSVLYTHV